MINLGDFVIYWAAQFQGSIGIVTRVYEAYGDIAYEINWNVSNPYKLAKGKGWVCINKLHAKQHKITW